LEIELTLLKMVHADSTVSISEVIQNLSQGNTGPSRTVARPREAAASPQKTVAPPPQKINYNRPELGADSQDEEDTLPAVLHIPQPGSGPDWKTILDEIMKDKPILGTFLAHSSLSSGAGGSLEIKFPASSLFQLEQVKKKENKDFITAKISQLLGRTTTVDFLIDKNKPAAQSREAPKFAPPAASKKKETFDEIAEKEPILNKILEVFDGEIIP
jgi:hypothetical protein